MRTLFFLLSFLMSGLLIANDPVTVSSVIRDVKVYRSGATVTRTARVTVPAGPVELQFPALSPFIDDNSLQARISKGFTILSVTSTREFLAEVPMPEAYNKLQAQIDKLEAEQKTNQAGLEVLNEEESLLLTNKKVGGDQSGLDVAALQKMAEYFRVRLTSIKTEKITLTDRLTESKKEIDKLKKQQAELRQRLRPDNARTIVVRLTSSSGGQADLELTYLTTNANWLSTFDIRVDEINKPLDIDYKGEVYNRTGEDWTGVDLTLSTGDPSRNNTLPVLYPWWVNFQQPMLASQAAGLQMDAANVRGSREKATNYYLDGVRITGDGIALGESSENLTTTEFALTEKFDIPADGKPYTVLLEKKTTEADYQYIVAPKRNALAFLTATVQDFEELNLSSGKANIYYGQTYIGETYLNTRQAGDSLQVSLGADIGIAIQRDKVKDKSAKNFFGNKVEETFTWVIKVKNNKSGTVNIRLQDQIPVSQDKEIEVKSEIGNGGKLDAESGIITWHLDLSPGQNQELRFTYQVKYPKGREIGL
ncbi:MAG: mucoidy inhibitor MuiA family protein [Lewinellaceae bacterium]|nr:mucoidy inhibitor MuiA family protein [Saprospiraceae bacterium]MCB9312762.1 mucoidy inhibitor MuiA family protein [Lewinellaceae bacterium]HRW74608.1 mucoidy inhibitor MuiA family protein [Saprospiraceae bacterium]